MRKIDQFSLFAIVLAFTFGSSFAQGTKTEASKTEKSSIVVPQATPAVTFHKIMMRVPPNAAISYIKGKNDKTLSDENTMGGTQYDCGHPTNEEQYMLELINRARANPADEGDSIAATTNSTILFQFQNQAPPTASQVKSELATYPSRPPLAFNPILIQIARAHDQDMLAKNYQGHTDSQGNDPFQRMTNADYKTWDAAGENVFAYGSDADETHQEFLCDFGNYPDIGHRHNILNFAPTDSIYNEIGIGAIHGGTGLPNVGTMITTEDFGRTPAHFYVTGVVYSDSNQNNFYDIGEGDTGIKITVSSGSSDYAISSGSGGYAIPMNSGFSGSVTVTASGGPLSSPIMQTVSVDTENVKVDFILPLTVSPPGNVTLVSPPNGSTTKDTVNFSWEGPAGSTISNYLVLVSKNSALTKPFVIKDTLIGTVTTDTGSQDRLLPNTTYYWSILAQNQGGWSAPSTIWSFKTPGSASVGELPIDQSATYFYPNPANSNAKLSFTLDAPSDVSFTLFTSAGAEVESVELGMLPAGANTLELDASKLESGVYECKLTMAGQTRMARLVVVK
ncbi:MAG TPA: CAP domain-containing protein [Candidatus Kapabacteria bacterium]|jgi:hypothetical protein